MPVRGRVTACTPTCYSPPTEAGARWRPPADLDTVVEVIQRASQPVADFPTTTELDGNPLGAGPDGVCAVDLRLTIDRHRLSTA